MFSEDTPAFLRDRIVTGKAQAIAPVIPSESVDLILCDPVYWEVDHYRWLAETAARVLKPGRSCIAESGHEDLIACANAMAEHLEYYWMLSERLTSSNARLWDKRIFARWKPFLWYWKRPAGATNCQGRYGQWMRDAMHSTPSKAVHEWGTGEGTMGAIILALTQPGDVVFDPFTGGGVVPALCKKLGRHYLACEIDDTTAFKARQRVEAVSPAIPLPGLSLETDEIANEAARAGQELLFDIPAAAAGKIAPLISLPGMATKKAPRRRKTSAPPAEKISATA